MGWANKMGQIIPDPWIQIILEERKKVRETKP